LKPEQEEKLFVPKTPSFFALVTFLFFLASPSSALGARGNVALLKNIDFQKFGETLEVTIEVEGEFHYQASEMENPSRIVFDLLKVNKVQTLPSYEVRKSGVERVRTGQFLPLIARVILDFQERKPFYRITQIKKGIKVDLWLEEELAKRIEDSMIGLILSSYHISSEDYQQIYGGGGTILGLDLSYMFLTRENLQACLSLEVRSYSKTGASTFTQEETRLSLRPISLAGECLIQTKTVVPFFGLGLDFYHYAEKSDIYEASGSALGYHIQGGLYYQIPKLNYLKIKVFIKMTKAVARENDLEVNLGGREYGLNLTYSFNFRALNSIF